MSLINGNNVVVSIIIATFNRQASLIQTLASIENQTFQNWECLIIDDGSTDNTKEVIIKKKEEDKRFSFHSRPGELKKGPSSCRNLGLGLVSGQYIQFFDDDDLMYPQMLETKLNAFKTNDLDVVVAPVDVFNVEANQIIKQNIVYSDNLIADYVTSNLTWYCSGPLWKREFLTERFDENIQALEDWDFNLRNIYKKPKVEYLSTPLQRYNRFQRGETLSTKAQTGDEEQLNSGFIAYRKQFLILKEKKLLSRDVKVWLIDRFTFFLRAALSNNYKLADDIYIFIMSNLNLPEKRRFWRIIAGYYSYKIFNRGYGLFNI